MAGVRQSHRGEVCSNAESLSDDPQTQVLPTTLILVECSARPDESNIAIYFSISGFLFFIAVKKNVSLAMKVHNHLRHVIATILSIQLGFKFGKGAKQVRCHEG